MEYPIRNEHQYGIVNHLGKKVLAHRVAWESANGPIPEGLLVCHTCDNPPCVNVDHLFVGTHLDNNRDRHIKGRSRNGWAERTHCEAGHEYTPENTRIAPQGHRICRTCALEASRKSQGYQGNPPPAKRTHCPRGHEYTDENTVILKKSTTGNPYRVCRICATAKRRKREGYKGNSPNGAKTHCIHGHEFTDENTVLQRRSDASGMKRICLTCRRERDRKRRPSGASGRRQP